MAKKPMMARKSARPARERSDDARSCIITVYPQEAAHLAALQEHMADAPASIVIHYAIKNYLEQLEKSRRDNGPKIVGRRAAFNLNEAVKLYESHWTMEQLGERYNLSRQRIHQLLDGRITPYKPGDGEPGKVRSFAFSPADFERLDRLLELTGLSQARVIRAALERLHAKLI